MAHRFDDYFLIYLITLSGKYFHVNLELGFEVLVFEVLVFEVFVF